MPQADINNLAVLASAIVNMVVGSLWYSPLLFGNQWIAAMQKTKAEMEQMKKGAGKAYAGSFIAALVMAYVLAHFVDFAGAASAREGMQAGFWVWLGFVATTGLSGMLFEQRPKMLYLINTGYYLVTLLIVGALLAVWQ